MPKRILVVDDDPVVQALARDRLKHAGYDVETASNGAVALHTLKRMTVDVIITDVLMPKMDGIDFYRELKKNVSTMAIPVVIVTENMRYRELFQKLGVRWFIEKPFNMEGLLSLIRQILKESGTNEKILISGVEKTIVSDMSKIIEGAGQGIAIAENSADIIAIALTITPKIILIDLMMKDLTAYEVVKALRCFIRLKDAKILTYTQFSPEEMSDVNSMEQLQQARDDCAEAGATKYIGRFTGPTFFQVLSEFL